MDKKQALISRIIESVFTRRYSRGVEKQIEGFFAEDAMREQKEIALKEQWEKMEVESSWIRSKIRYRDLKKRINSEDSQIRSRGFGRAIAFASVAFLMLGVGGWMFMQRDKMEQREFIAESVEQDIEGVVVSGELFEIGLPIKNMEQPPKVLTTAKAKPALRVVEPEEISVTNSSLMEREVVLDDGSKVTLYANSQIKYARKFLEKEVREVELIGGASFEVAKNDAVKQFVVATEKLSVSVLGTVFDMEAYGWSDEVSVALHSGSVGVTVKDGEEIKLSPNEKLLYNISDGSVDIGVIVEEQQQAVEIDWKHGPLVFEAMTISEIAEAICIRFDVGLEMEQSVRDDDRVYHARFDRNVKIEVVLMVLKATIAGVDMRVVDGKLMVK